MSSTLVIVDPAGATPGAALHAARRLQNMSNSVVGQANRDYVKRFVPFIVAYVLAVAAISGWLGWEPSFIGLRGLALAASPALPIGGVIWAGLRYLEEESDEFLRMKHVRVSLVSLGATLLCCTAWGFAAQYAGVWALPLYLVFPMYCAFGGLAWPCVNWRFR